VKSVNRSQEKIKTENQHQKLPTFFATAAAEEAAASAATPDCSQRRAGNNKLR